MSICEKPNCKNPAIFNYPNKSSGSYCTIHKLEGMKSIHADVCLECQLPATHGTPTHCEFHKKPDQVCIIELPQCVSCSKPQVAIYNDQGYCLECYPCKTTLVKIANICVICNPEYYEINSNSLCKECFIAKKQVYITEFTIMKHLYETIDTPFIHNGKHFRPSILFDLAQHVVIVEVDFHQHSAYQESCECARVSEIVSSIGGKPIIIIRFNPDSFSFNSVKQTMKLADRLPLLTEVVKRELIAIPEKFVVKVIQLYFDCNEETLRFEQSMDITSIVAC